MARGRAPKDPELRHNKASAVTATAANLPPRGSSTFTETARPPLPATLFPNKKVHRQTKVWWTAIWASEMAGRWLESDIPNLHRLAMLVNAYYLEPSPRLSSEIRAIQDQYGLTPFGRKRLDWRIDGPLRTDKLPMPIDDEPDETAPPPPPRKPEGPDPRSVLRAV